MLCFSCCLLILALSLDSPEGHLFIYEYLLMHIDATPWVLHVAYDASSKLELQMGKMVVDIFIFKGFLWEVLFGICNVVHKWVLKNVVTTNIDSLNRSCFSYLWDIMILININLDTYRFLYDSYKAFCMMIVGFILWSCELPFCEHCFLQHCFWVAVISCNDQLHTRNSKWDHTTCFINMQ